MEHPRNKATGKSPQPLEAVNKVERVEALEITTNRDQKSDNQPLYRR